MGVSEDEQRIMASIRAGKLAEAGAMLAPIAASGAARAETIRALAQSLMQAGDLNAAYDWQKTLLPPDLAGADAQGRADALMAAQLAQMTHDYDGALAIARDLIASDPGDLAAAGLLATLELWTSGADAARQALSGVAIDDLDAHAIGQLLAYHDSAPADLVARAQDLAEDAHGPAQKRADLLFALAQHFDRAADYAKAWSYAERANAIAPQRQSLDWAGVLAAHRSIAANTRQVPAGGGPGHCYLLGLPRSGQSVLQSVLTAHPEVFSLGERGALLQHILFRTNTIMKQPPDARNRYYADLAQSDRRGIARLAQAPAWVVDKSPLHLAVAGSVARIHAGAKFAAVLRDPADIALSIWFRSFPEIYSYANDMTAILDHIAFSFTAIEGWLADGLAIMLIDHRQLVTRPDEVCADLFGWLGLSWQDDYLKPENRTQPVPTFSAAQVRQTISPASVRSASPYGEQLKPHMQLIEDLRGRMTALLRQHC